MTKNESAGQATARAAHKFNRRSLIRNAAALAILTPAAPMFVKNAFAATSGELNVLMWGEYLIL